MGDWSQVQMGNSPNQARFCFAIARGCHSHDRNLFLFLAVSLTLYLTLMLFGLVPIRTNEVSPAHLNAEEKTISVPV